MLQLSLSTWNNVEIIIIFFFEEQEKSRKCIILDRSADFV